MERLAICVCLEEMINFRTNPQRQLLLIDGRWSRLLGRVDTPPDWSQVPKPRIRTFHQRAVALREEKLRRKVTEVSRERRATTNEARCCVSLSYDLNAGEKLLHAMKFSTCMGSSRPDRRAPVPHTRNLAEVNASSR